MPPPQMHTDSTSVGPSCRSGSVYRPVRENFSLLKSVAVQNLLELPTKSKKRAIPSLLFCSPTDGSQAEKMVKRDQ